MPADVGAVVALPIRSGPDGLHVAGEVDHAAGMAHLIDRYRAGLAPQFADTAGQRGVQHRRAHRMAGFRVLASSMVSQPGRIMKSSGYSLHPPFKQNLLREIRDFESNRRPEGEVALS